MIDISKQILVALIILGLFSCSPKKDYVLEEFESQIQKQGLKIDSIDKEEVIYLTINEANLEITLDNLRRDYQRDKDKNIIEEFVKTITNTSLEVPKDWNNVKQKIFISFFQNDYNFKNIIHEKVTEDFSKIFTLSDNEKFTWLTTDDIKKWNISVRQLNEQANKNADSLLSMTQIRYEIIENKKLGIIEVEHQTLKGALLFAPSMKVKIEKEIGFPFYAVLPVRDFCYIFSEKDFRFFSNRLGDVVVDEYKNSGYPISTEILKFTAKGIETAGKYPLKQFLNLKM